MKKNEILDQPFKRCLKHTQIVCILLSVLVLPVLSAQSIQELQRLKTEYEKFQKGQKQVQLPTGVDGGIDPTTGLPRQAQIAPYQPIEITDEMEKGPELIVVYLNCNDS